MNIIADTCFWISLCDPQDGNHSEAVLMMERILHNGSIRILVPHPVLYESLCSKMVRKPNQVQTLTSYFTQVDKVADEKYIDEAFNTIVSQAIHGSGEASMVDIVIMMMSDDPENHVKGVLTSNGRDFSQFCYKHHIPMINSLSVLEAV